MGVRDSDPPSDAITSPDLPPIPGSETPQDSDDPALPFARTALSLPAPGTPSAESPSEPAPPDAPPAPAVKRQRPQPQPEHLRAAMTAALARSDANIEKPDASPDHTSSRPAPRPNLRSFPKTGSEASPSVNQSLPKSRAETIKRVVLRITQVALALLLVAAAAVFFTVRHYEANLPSIEQLKAGYDPPQVTRVLARD